MNEREAFEKALQDNPLDDTTRLVYADWLEENGFDDEAARMRAWRAAYDYMAQIAADSGGTCTNYGDDYDEHEYEEYTAEDMIQAGHELLEHGDYLVQVGAERLRDYVDRKEYWKNWEIITGIIPPEKDSYGYELGTPFSCSC